MQPFHMNHRSYIYDAMSKWTTRSNGLSWRMAVVLDASSVFYCQVPAARPRGNSLKASLVFPRHAVQRGRYLVLITLILVWFYLLAE